jgi:acetyl esterase/lipase
MQSTLSQYYYESIKQQLLAWNGMNLEERRSSYEEISIQRGNFSKAVEVVPAQFGTVSGDWLIPHQQSTDGIIIHLHGGAFAVGNALTHRAIGSHLAQYSGARVILLNYSLSPEHQFPVAMMDVVHTFELLKKEHSGQKVALSGDSAGANLALTASLYLRGEGKELPNAIGLICPWSDLTMSNPSHQKNAAVDPYFPNSDRLHASAKGYAGEASLKDPLVSPQFGSYDNLPPILTHIGEYEALLDDAKTVHQLATKAGVNSQLEVYPAMWHVWQHFVGLMPEATDSLQKMGTFLGLHLKSI